MNSYEEIWNQFNKIADELKELELVLAEEYSNSKLIELFVTIKEIHNSIEIREKVKKWIITQTVKDLKDGHNIHFIPILDYNKFYEMNVNLLQIREEFEAKYVKNKSFRNKAQSTFV